MEAMNCQATRPKDYIPQNQQVKDTYGQKKGQGSQGSQRKGDSHLEYDLVSLNKNQNANRGYGPRGQYRGQNVRVEGQGGGREYRQDYRGQGQGYGQREGTPERNGDQGKMPKSQGKRQRKKKVGAQCSS